MLMKIVSCIFGLGAFVALISAASAQTEADPVDCVAAVVNEHIITYSEVLNYSGEAERTAMATFRGDELRKQIWAARKDALNTLVERALILDEFQKKGHQFPEYYVDSQVRQTINAEYGGNRLAFLQGLHAQGVSLEDYRKKIRDKYIIAEFTRHEVGNEVVVSPQKMAQYYQAHLDQFKLEDRVHLRVIYLRKEGMTTEEVKARQQIAVEILQQLDAGADFALMAQMYSEHPTRDVGGDWGWTDRKDLGTDFRDIAFSLNPKEHSAAIETKDGIYILYADEANKSHVEPLTEVRDQLQRILEQQERARLQKQWVDRLKKKAFVRIYPPFNESEKDHS